MRQIITLNNVEYIVFENAIYQHYKGNYYRTIQIAYDRDSQNKAIISYHRCDENGIFKSIRNNWCSACMNSSTDKGDNECRICGGFGAITGDKEKIIGQPFFATIETFTEGVLHNNEYQLRFKLTKIL